MEYSNPRFAFAQSHVETDVNSKPPPNFFAEHDANVLDSAFADADIMPRPHPDALPMRRTSYMNNPSALMSPTNPPPWSSHFAPGIAGDPTSALSSPHHEHHHAFGADASQQPPVFEHAVQPSPWSFEHRPDFDHPPPPANFAAPHFVHQRSDSARGSFSQPPPRQDTFPGSEESFMPAPQVQTPMSPHSHADYMIMAQQEMDGREHRPLPSHMTRGRGRTPAQTTVDHNKGDGVRKKNARIEIPAEHTIANINHLLSFETLPETVKKLKGHKRLLRNREAALASRQRKKRHTEDLEATTKAQRGNLEELSTRIRNYEFNLQRQAQECQILRQSLAAAKQDVESLREEKRDLTMKHVEETSTLRARVRVLESQCEHGLTAPGMSAAPSSTGMGDFSAEMEALNMGPYDWTGLMYDDPLHTDPLGDIDFDTKPEATQPDIIEPPAPPPASTVSTKPKHILDETSSDQNVTQGMLFFLLLCGAFVASRPLGLQGLDLSQVPANVRAVAPKLLDNLLYEHPSATASNTRPSELQGPQEPAASSGLPLPRAQNSLDRLHNEVTSMTQQQEIDAAFSLTNAQYASIANDVGYGGRPGSPLQPARNTLAERLADMQLQGFDVSRAEVYTRSLLWDQIPIDVIKQFQDLVREHRSMEAQQKQQHRRQNDDETNEFKVDL